MVDLLTRYWWLHQSAYYSVCFLPGSRQMRSWRRAEVHPCSPSCSQWLCGIVFFSRNCSRHKLWLFLKFWIFKYMYSMMIPLVLPSSDSFSFSFSLSLSLPFPSSLLLLIPICSSISLLASAPPEVVPSPTTDKINSALYIDIWHQTMKYTENTDVFVVKPLALKLWKCVVLASCAVSWRAFIRIRCV